MHTTKQVMNSHSITITRHTDVIEKQCHDSREHLRHLGNLLLSGVLLISCCRYYFPMDTTPRTCETRRKNQVTYFLSAEAHDFRSSGMIDSLGIYNYNVLLEKQGQQQGN
jgi:hypothetical protein